MTRYLVTRILSIIPTVLLLLLFVVVLVRVLPGNAVDALVGDSAVSKADRAAIEHELGLDRNIVEDYLRYAGQILRGDLGTSLITKTDVYDLVADRGGVTLELAIMSFVFAVVTGVLIGIVSAVSQNSPADFFLRSISILGLSIPPFALATMWVVLPTIWWGWSPSIIYKAPSQGWWPHVTQFIAPAVVLGFALSATLMRITRTMMLEVLRMDYIRTARAKGLASRNVVWRHALRNAMIPVISLLGTQVAYLLSGTIIIESVFSLPGIGRELINAVGKRDYTVVQGLTVVTGAAVIAINLLVDVSYGIIDPRAKA